MDEKESKVRLAAHAQLADACGGGITIDPELEEAAEELVEEGWLQRGESEKGETGYVITNEGKTALALAQLTMNTSEN